MTTAQLPPIEDSADKVFTTTEAVVVLDGASAFVPVPVPAATYADHLGRNILAGLGDSDAHLRAVLAEAIDRTAGELNLSPGSSPSSTVLILRRRADEVDVLALGDSVVILPDETMTDDRIDSLDLTPRSNYQERLRAGAGYDDTHAQLLRELQNQQATHRNAPDGYWIAEAEPNAADHALMTTRPVEATPWAVLATDGAYNTIEATGLDDWPSIAASTREDLAELLERCRTWERDRDPDGQQLPRAKRHDDKAIAAVRFEPIREQHSA
nr:hypothetical protein [Saccharomonospora halophila]